MKKIRLISRTRTVMQYGACRVVVGCAQAHTELLWKKAGVISEGYLYLLGRMVFQQMGKQDNAGRFERGYLKVTTESLTSWTSP